jgi:hypothetical protein
MTRFNRLYACYFSRGKDMKGQKSTSGGANTSARDSARRTLVMGVRERGWRMYVNEPPNEASSLFGL